MAKKKSPTAGKKKIVKKAPKKTVAGQRRRTTAARILLDPLLDNPDYPHGREVTVTGSTVRTSNEEIKWTIKDDAGGVADGRAYPVPNTTDQFTITIPPDTLNDLCDVYILKAFKEGVLPASLVLDTLG